MYKFKSWPATAAEEEEEEEEEKQKKRKTNLEKQNGPVKYNVLGTMIQYEW